MSTSIALVCEGVTDPPTICALADRTILSGITWIDPDEIDTHRHYRGFEPNDSYLTWFHIDNLAKQFRVRSHGHLEGSSLHGDGHNLRKAMALLIFHSQEDNPVDAIIFFRDGDREYEERVKAIQDARDNPITPTSPESIPVIVGIANRMRECWLLNGFEPANDWEHAQLATERERVGFDPRFRAHELTATNESEHRSPKRVLRSLTSGDQDRERACVFDTSIETLRARGAETGLLEFLNELQERLIAAFR